MGKGLSLRARLILLITVILVAGFLTTNIISFRVSTATLKETILHKELPLTSSNIYSEIQADLLRPIFVSSLMSNDTFLKDWMIGGESDPDSVTRYLEEIRRRYGVFTSFVISDRTHKYYHFSGLAQIVDPNDPEDVWYFRARDMAAPYEINIDYNQEQGNEVTIFVNYRLLDYDGKFIGVTGVGLHVGSVSAIVARYAQDYNRNVYFVDRSGQVTVRSGNAPMAGANILTTPGLADVGRRILEADHGFFEYQRYGQTLLVTTRDIPELGWHVVVEQNEAEVLADLWRGFLANLGIGGAIILITIATIAYAVNMYQRRLEEMATTDKLTGIGNRQVFDLALDHALKLGQRSPQPLSVILLDIDHFKRINDTYGHLTGDKVIREVADIVRRQVREADVLCRWGGEEIIILAHDCPLANAVTVAEKLRAAVAESSVSILEHGIRVTVSAGVAEYCSGEGAEGFIGRADAALYCAKREGRNRVALAEGPQAAAPALA